MFNLRIGMTWRIIIAVLIPVAAIFSLAAWYVPHLVTDKVGNLVKNELVPTLKSGFAESQTTLERRLDQQLQESERLARQAFHAQMESVVNGLLAEYLPIAAAFDFASIEKAVARVVEQDPQISSLKVFLDREGQDIIEKGEAPPYALQIANESSAGAIFMRIELQADQDELLTSIKQQADVVGGIKKDLVETQASLLGVATAQTERVRINVADSLGQLTTQLFIAGAVALALLGFLLLLFLRAMIIRPLLRVATRAKDISNGNLAGTASLIGVEERADELGDLARTFVSMEMVLRELISSLSTSVTDLATSIAQISATAQEVAATASEQQATVAQVTTTTEQILQTSRVTVTNANDVFSTSEEAVASGQAGQDSVGAAQSTIAVINDRVSEIATKILQLADQNEHIGGIIAQVNDISEQSNLLAVNASIEASKAGEQGRGFAVVASEVRSLADQSKRSTTEIRTILDDIRKATQSVVMATEEGTKRTQDGQQAIKSVSEVIDSLGAVLEETSSKASQIAGAAQQQTSGIQEIATAMSAVAQASTDSLSGARDLEKAVSDLSALAKQIQSVTDDYVVA